MSKNKTTVQKQINKPNVKLSHPERASKLLENDQLPVAGPSTLGAKRIRVGCSALFGCIAFI